MRWAALGLLLGGCQTSVGIWQVDQITVGDATANDAGFIDLRSNGDVSSGLSHVLFLRYHWDSEAGDWAPDPTPEHFSASFDVRRYDEGERDVPITLDFPLADGTSVPVTLTGEAPKTRSWTLEDPNFPDGPLTWSLVR